MGANIEGVGKVSSMRQALDKLERFGKTVQRVRKERQEQVELGVGVGAVLAGGAAAGYIRAKWANELMLPGDIPADAVASLAFIGLGVSGMGGRNSHALAMLGAGLGAGVLALEVQKRA